MRKLVAWFFVMFLCRFAAAQDILIDKNSRISFFSEAPLENIEAVTSKAAAALDIKANEIAFKVPVSSFEFRKQLMREHFNENYLESEKFPYATFNGKINEAVDWNVDGTYPVTVAGMLDIHGIKKRYETQAIVEVKGSVINAQAAFAVKVADHEIEIPRIVIKNIAEQVDVKVSSTFRKQ